MRWTERWPMYGTHSGYAWSTHAPATKPIASISARAPPLRATLRFMSADYRRPPDRSAAEPDARVLVVTVDPDLKVEVRASRPTRRSLEGHGRASRNHLPGAKTGCVAREMSVVGRVTVAVDDHEQVAVADAAGVEVSDPGVGGHDVRAVWTRDIQPRVDLVRIRAVRVID